MLSIGSQLVRRSLTSTGRPTGRSFFLPQRPSRVLQYPFCSHYFHSVNRRRNFTKAFGGGRNRLNEIAIGNELFSNSARKDANSLTSKIGIRRVSTITSSLPAEPPRRSLPVRILIFIAIACIAYLGGYVVGAASLLKTYYFMIYPPTDEETLVLFNPASEDPAFEINATILNHPLTQALHADPKFIASRPHLKIPAVLRRANFTGGTLMGEDKIPAPPLTFSTSDGTESVSIQYLGAALCGHPGVVHGGMLATLLDEGLARCCFPGMPNKVAVTASLKVDYRKPCMAQQYVVLKAKTTKFEGRKAWVTGRLETLPLDGSQGQLLAEAEALFIEPRNAAVNRGSDAVKGTG